MLNKTYNNLLILTVIFCLWAGIFTYFPSNVIALESMDAQFLQSHVPKNSNHLFAEKRKNNAQLLRNSSINNDSFHSPFAKKDIPKLETNNKNQKYSMSQLNQLSYQKLKDLLITIQWYDIQDLFEFNPDSLKFYQDPNRVQTLIDALSQQGKLYTNNDSKGIETLVEVLRSGFYLGYYHVELQYLNERSFQDKCLPALKIIAKNPNFQLGTSEQDKVISSYGKLIGNSSSDVQTIQYAAPILKQYNKELENYMKEYSKRDAIYSLIHGIGYDLETYLNVTQQQPNQTQWYQTINDFVDQLGTLALSEHITNDTGWLINNAIYYIGKIGVFHSTSSKGLQILTQALQLYPYLTEQYITAAQRIVYDYNAKDYYGNKVDLDKIREEGKSKYLPKTYTFDDGSMIIKVGDQVTEDKIKRLYWASKEVQAQFFRVVGHDQPLEKGHKDDVLTMVIYNNPRDYLMNNFLYGYDTNNGGIYIEEIGTFFTYERTPQDSVFSLEELFRHEFTHYLQGRYEVPGLFGQGEMYQDERLTWYEEGNAEFFAGSTRMDSVVPRRSIIDQLATTDPMQRYNTSQTLYARYGTWDFYNYSFVLQSHLYNNHFDILDKLDYLIRDNNVSGYDTYRKTLSNDKILNQEYLAYMQQLINNKNQYYTPMVSDDYIKSHVSKPLQEISQEIAEIAKLKDVKINDRHSQFFNTFTLEGTYVLENPQGTYEDWKQMNKKMNEDLKVLSNKTWSGYKTLTAYFVNSRINAAGRLEYDVVFNGVNTQGNIAVEKEPNNSFETANSLPLNTLLRASLDEKDQTDRFVIDIKKAKDLQITVTDEQNLQMNWVLSDERDLRNYVTYATKHEGNKLIGNYYAQPRKYYLVIYKSNSRTGNYTVEVK
ncbi:collagenase [Bacillus toyonensis]|uniref:collagenase n=1 Tax=Bacillus toyonensis TaxID=155322 RepID=UPI003D22F510